MLLKLLSKTSSNRGYLQPHKILPVGSQERVILPFWSTGQRSEICPLCLRSTARSTGPGTREQRLSSRSTAPSTGTGYGEQSSLPVDRGHFQIAELPGRSIAQSTSPPVQTAVHVCARRSTGPIDRLLPRSAVRSTGRRQASLFLGIKNLGF